jgi:glycyl-tRNA synthetase alpha chain
LDPISVEITYGIERLAMYIQKVDSVYDLEWVDGISYGDVYLQNEKEQSKYNFEIANTDMLFNVFEQYEKEALNTIQNELVLPAYDCALKCSHIFNLLDARGAISVTERVGYIARIRKLARKSAKLYVVQREKLDYPLIKKVISNAK